MRRVTLKPVRTAIAMLAIAAAGCGGSPARRPAPPAPAGAPPATAGARAPDRPAERRRRLAEFRRWIVMRFRVPADAADPRAGEDPIHQLARAIDAQYGDQGSEKLETAT